MLNHEVVPNSDSAPLVELQASIRIDGDRSGVVRIGMPQTLARSAAAAMLACSPDDASEEDVSDALGELANMIGGSLKSLFPTGSQLGLPQVGMVGTDAEPGTAEPAHIDHVSFKWENAEFVVTIEHADAPQRNGDAAA